MTDSNTETKPQPRYVYPIDCQSLVPMLADGSVNLWIADPPYYGVVDESWDNQWPNVSTYVDWFVDTLTMFRPKLAPTASIVFFGGIGAHGHRPLFDVMRRIEQLDLLRYRNLITWGKRRAYGKSHDYLFTREEIAWYSVASERTAVTFNVPYLEEKRGYAGFNPKYPAKSEFKRVSNVWTDISELFKPERKCQKPLALLKRLVATHSNPGDIVVDPFVGWGTTGVAALELGRNFVGAEVISADADAADARCATVVTSRESRP